MYETNVKVIENYINPIVGKQPIQSASTLTVEKHLQTLQCTKPVEKNGRKAKTEYLTAASIVKINKLLRCAFSQAVRWELIAKNPFENTKPPKAEATTRDIWTADIIRIALEQCRDSKLYLAINLAFACSLRLGEILGMTWDCVDISDEAIINNNANVRVEKELTRVSKSAMKTLNNKDIIYEFPSMKPNATTALVLKKPKTVSSGHRVWLPQTVVEILKTRREAQEKQKEYLGEECFDYNLVVALFNGKPCENKLIEEAFKRLKRDANLPNVVFHSLRHSSATYKLKFNNGDIKATQGDTGHAQADMVTRIYAHIVDGDRNVNAQKFEAEFYSNPDLRKVNPNEPPQTEDALNSLIEQLKKSAISKRISKSD